MLNHAAPKLNPRQEEAVHHIDGPLQVVAGPGTGKTRVITEKVVAPTRDKASSFRGEARSTRRDLPRPEGAER
jgi:hypothetical protein